MPTARLAGAGVFWRAWGEGPRRAVAIHAGLTHSGAWEGIARALPPGLQLQAFDLPGHGQSEDWAGDRDYTDLAVDIAHELIGGDEVDLFGHSFGGVVALRVAVERPETVRGLVLYEPVLFAAAAARGFDTRSPLAPFRDAWEAGDRAEAARRFVAFWGGLGAPWEDLPERQRQALAARIHLIPATAPAVDEDTAGLLAPGRLGRIGAPVLLLDGSASPPVARAIADALADLLPHARRQTIEGAGHMGPITHAEAIAEAIAGHLGL